MLLDLPKTFAAAALFAALNIISSVSITKSYEGQLEFQTPDGEPMFYTGCIVDDIPEGYGALAAWNGLVYVGYWSNGLPHGIGEIKHPDGSVERGIWRKGFMVADMPQHYNPARFVLD